MPEKLGICVARPDSMTHVLGLARAAKKGGRDIDIFLTGQGVHLTRDPRFPELLKVARIGVCEVSYHANGYKGQPVPGLADKDFVTQMRNAEMVEKCDRYLVL
ncbi:MAG: hypothetical protein Q8P24_14975 [Desulfobacterales bacterium]|nr:hypothetical protein [Desulfobacterales bacterium]